MINRLHRLQVETRGKGLYEITDSIQRWLAGQQAGAGLLTVFIQHTSASLTVQENADPDVVYDLNQFFGNTPQAVIRPNERTLLSFDAPDRVLLWGQYEGPYKTTIAPVYEWHTGFPYSVVNESLEFVGPRNRAGRFPSFSSLDLQVTKEVKLPIKELKARVGVRVFNLLNHYNPRDFQNNLDSGRFGTFFNSVDRTFRGKFVLEF